VSKGTGAIDTGDQFFCSAGVFRVEMRPHHVAPRTAALVEGTREDCCHAGHPGLEMPSSDFHLYLICSRLMLMTHRCLRSTSSSLLVVR